MSFMSSELGSMRYRGEDGLMVGVPDGHNRPANGSTANRVTVNQRDRIRAESETLPNSFDG
jgi:hypothetical protein